jgi:hypothetical protein
MTQMPFAAPQSGIPEGPPPIPSVWPKVIGFISIALASHDLIRGPNYFLIRGFIRHAHELMKISPEWWSTYTTVSSVVGIIMVLILLGAGITTLMRRGIGRSLHLVYGAAGILITIGNVVVIAMMLLGAEMVGPMRVGFFIGWIVVGVPLGMIYPVFLIIWFLRSKIRQEVAAWGR